jgi:hypothetical protein
MFRDASCTICESIATSMLSILAIYDVVHVGEDRKDDAVFYQHLSHSLPQMKYLERLTVCGDPRISNPN